MHLVVVDCPPVLPCREAASRGAVADGTLLVVEAERTRRADIAQAREVLEQLGATMLGVVLNKRRKRGMPPLHGADDLMDAASDGPRPACAPAMSLREMVALGVPAPPQGAGRAG